MSQRMFNKVVLALIAILLLGGALQAGVDDVKAKIENERISLDLKEASLAKVFEIYRTLLGVEVRIRCAREPRVTIAFDNITVRTSLNAICESAGLRWSLEASEPPALLIECQSPPVGSQKQELSPLKAAGQPGPGSDWVKVYKSDKQSVDRLELVVSIQLQDAELDKVLRMAAKVLDAKLAMDFKLEHETVTLSLDKSTMRQFLDAVCDQVHATWQLSTKEEPLLMVDKKKP